MAVVKTKINSTVIYSDDNTKRYVLTIEWDKDKPMAAVIMLCAGTSNGISFDRSTCLTIDNLVRLDYGGVKIVNLFAEINDGRSVVSKEDDKRNITYIANVAKEADTIIYAAGTGKANNCSFRRRLEQAMDKLRPYEEKLMCITDGCGGKFYHPLFPRVREWQLEHCKIADLIGSDEAIKGKTEQEAEKVALQNKNAE